MQSMKIRTLMKSIMMRTGPETLICTNFFMSPFSSLKSYQFKTTIAFDLNLPEKEEGLSPIILLHGLLEYRKTWKTLAPCFAKTTGRKVYSPDARNHGESFWHEEFNYDLTAEDLGLFLQEQNISKAILVGHSLGGKTAITFALKKPEMVEKLVIEDMTPRNFSSRTYNSIKQKVAVMRESLSTIPPGADEMTARTSVISHMKNSLAPDKMSENGSGYELDMLPLKNSGDKYSWMTNLDGIDACLTAENFRQHLSNIYLGDALFLCGELSPFSVAKDEQVKKFFPRATLVEISGASHMIHNAFPLLFFRKVSSFINGDNKKFCKL